MKVIKVWHREGAKTYPVSTFYFAIQEGGVLEIIPYNPGGDRIYFSPSFWQQVEIIDE